LNKKLITTNNISVSLLFRFLNESGIWSFVGELGYGEIIWVALVMGNMWAVYK
jgi:hypothetical protein